MKLLSAPVLIGAVLASSPALYQGLVTRTVPLETAASRFAVALAIAWLAMSAVALLVGEPPKPVAVPDDSSTAEGVHSEGEAGTVAETSLAPAPSDEPPTQPLAALGADGPEAPQAA